MLASAGAVAVVAGAANAGRRLPFRTGRELLRAIGFVSSDLTGEISGAMTVVGTSPEIGLATGPVGTVAGVGRLTSATGGSTAGTVTVVP